jgi:hypothetical protein
MRRENRLFLSHLPMIAITRCHITDFDLPWPGSKTVEEHMKHALMIDYSTGIDIQVPDLRGRALRNNGHSRVFALEESPNKKVYSVTKKGLQELRQWLAESGKSSGSHTPFLAQLHFSDIIPVAQQILFQEERAGK